MNREARTAAIEARIGQEISSMREILRHHADRDAFLTLEQWSKSTLRNIGDLIAKGHIQPAAADGLSGTAAHARLDRHSLRLGVFPTAANPLHWGHLLAGLAAMERFYLDKVIYIVAGEDSRKATLAPEPVRHQIAKAVLGIFSPLLEYSPLALGTAKPGELNVFRFFEANDGRPLHVFYLAGSDHFHRFTPREGRPDTLQRLETGIHKRTGGFNPRRHKLSAVFLDRGDCPEPVESSLDVRWIGGLPVQVSSTVIRGALGGEGPLCELVGLPFTAYCAICEQGTYQMQGENAACRESERDFSHDVGDRKDHADVPQQQAEAYASGGGVI